MTPDAIAPALSQLFSPEALSHPNPEAWQVETDDLRLLFLLSEDGAWLRILTPIAPLTEAQPYLEQLLEANFDFTQETRYAIHQGVLWGVYHHALASLTLEDFQQAIARLVVLKQSGLDDSFNRLTEQRILEIIRAAKAQGQSLEATLKSIERSYAEGMLGGVEQDPQQQERFLEAWRYQLQRLWNEA